MKRFIFFPIWKYRDLETRLQLFEEQGWRLENIRFSYLFVFKKSMPKKVDYVFYHRMAKDGRWDLSQKMIEYALSMLSEHNATKISTKSTFYEVYRITANDSDLSEYKTFRSEYLNHVLLQYLIISSFSPIVGLGIFLAGLFQHIPLWGMILSGIYLLFSLLAFSYCLFGYIRHKSLVKKWKQS